MPSRLGNRSHFVYLGGGAQYGVAVEGALKLMEMSQVFTQSFHPLEYRHGPISLVDERTVAVLLYSADQRAAEAKLAGELIDKGALVVGIGGEGNISFAVPAEPALAGLVYLPALQLLGERVAQSRKLDTAAPRHSDQGGDPHMSGAAAARDRVLSLLLGDTRDAAQTGITSVCSAHPLVLEAACREARRAGHGGADRGHLQPGEPGRRLYRHDAGRFPRLRGEHRRGGRA